MATECNYGSCTNLATHAGYAKGVNLRVCKKHEKVTAIGPVPKPAPRPRRAEPRPAAPAKTEPPAAPQNSGPSEAELKAQEAAIAIERERAARLEAELAQLKATQEAKERADALELELAAARQAAEPPTEAVDPKPE